MNLTDEQNAIIESSGDVKIHAVAGSGKTSTLVEYAKTRNKNSRILYLAFNRSVRQEAQRRFMNAGAGNVTVETAHSLAFRRIVPACGYQVRPEYKPWEIKEILNILPINRDPISALVLAGHIGRLVSLFCAGTVSKVHELDYSLIDHDQTAEVFVKKHRETIIEGARKFLALMHSGKIPVTHEFYLKRYQLSQPRLQYDIILFDEGQDASPVMLDIFLKQENAVKLIVGDVNQQIYSWRHAVNALAGVDFKSYMLTTSFRFSQRIADLASECLSWKKHLGDFDDIPIHGVGKSTRTKLKATLARTNLSLLRNAVEFLEKRNAPKKIYFEGNYSSYTYASEGASIWDILNLYLDDRTKIRDKLVASMGSFDDLVEYAELSEDTELLTLTDLVRDYGRKLPYYVHKLKEIHLADEHREEAEMIFSTVHRCKGMEYDSIFLENDFIDESKVKKAVVKKEISQSEVDKIGEEINLLYVAITRTKNRITFPRGLLEADFDAMPVKSRFKKNSTSSFVNKMRSEHSSAYQPWTEDQDDRLRVMIEMGRSIKEIGTVTCRNSGAIRSRLKKLGLT